MSHSTNFNSPGKAPMWSFSGFIKPLLFAGLICGLWACGSDDGGGDPQEDYNREAMFAHIGNNIILPNYRQLLVEATGLKNSGEAFTSNPDLTGLTAFREQFKATYLAFQKVKMLEFGPASNQSFRAALNTYPANKSRLDENISNGDINLDALSNKEAKGLPALDYLLFGESDDQAQLDAYTVATDATNRKNYVNALLEAILEETEDVLTGWEASGGNYIATFISSTGTDVGSSLGLLVNELNFDYELIKNAKVGIPLGVKTLGIPAPEKSESLYAGWSVELALENLLAIRDLFLGQTADGANGSGLDDHLDHVDARHDGSALSTVIADQLTSVETALEAIPTPIHEAVIDQASLVQEAYNELQRGVILLKTDMPSALGVLITYQDSDGD